MATKRRNRAIEMLEASLAPKAPGVSAANKGRESGEHSDQAKGPLHAKAHGRGASLPERVPMCAVAVARVNACIV